MSRRTSIGQQVRGFTRSAAALPFRPERRNVGLDQPLERVVEEIDAFRPDVLRGYGSMLDALFTYIDVHDLRLRLPRVVLYGGDALTPAGRRRIEDRFGIPSSRATTRWSRQDRLRL